MYRHELKYLITELDYNLLAQRLGLILDKDAHCLERDYHIRSLYFDDALLSSYNEKEEGAYERAKYRLRYYNGMSTLIKAEIKEKRDRYVHKKVAPINEVLAQALVLKEFDRFTQEKFKAWPVLEVYQRDILSRDLHPVVVVDYEREAYVEEALGIRITFDKNIRCLAPNEFFDPEAIGLPVLATGTLIMEVKYFEVFPKYIKSLLQVGSLIPEAYSKYVLCMDQLMEWRGVR